MSPRDHDALRSGLAVLGLVPAVALLAVALAEVRDRERGTAA
jgi:hypothetical protein